MQKIRLGLTASAIAIALIGAFAFKAPKELLVNGYQGDSCDQIVTCGTGNATCTVGGQSAFTDQTCKILAKQPNP